MCSLNFRDNSTAGIIFQTYVMNLSVRRQEEALACALQRYCQAGVSPSLDGKVFPVTQKFLGCDIPYVDGLNFPVGIDIRRFLYKQPSTAEGESLTDQLLELFGMHIALFFDVIQMKRFSINKQDFVFTDVNHCFYSVKTFGAWNTYVVTEPGVTLVQKAVWPQLLHLSAHVLHCFFNDRRLLLATVQLITSR